MANADPGVVILGAGIIGVTTAWALAKEGRRVTVIERRGEAAAETSFANAGLVAPGHALTWASPRAPKILFKSLFRDDQALRLKLRADPAMWRWCWQFLLNCTDERSRRNTVRKLRLCVYSQQALRALVAETGLDYDGIRRGLLYVYRDPAALEAGIARMKILRDHGQKMDVVDEEAIAQIEPVFAETKDKIAGGLYCPEDESGDSRKFTLGLVAKCQEKGVAFRFGTTITGFDAEGDRVRSVLTDQGPVAGSDFVLSLGSYSPRVVKRLGLDLPVYPVKGYSATVPIAGRNGAPTVGGVDENNLVAWCRMGDRLRLTATAEFSGFDTSHRPSDFKTMLASARDLFPQGGDYAQASYWACLRPMTPAGTPIHGRGRHRNFWINTGQGHMGWTMACGSARITADLMAGRAPEIDTTGMVYGSA
jgi:D-amino-acid dehydrogenase